MLSMGDDATNVAIYGKQSHTYVLEKNEVVDLLVINWFVGISSPPRLLLT